MDKCDLCLWNQGSGGGGGGGGSTTLAGLTDADISNPSDGQTLVYNSTTGKWENGDVGRVLALHVDTQTGALDKTWQEIYDQVNAGAYCFVLDSFNYDGITGLSLYYVTSIEDQTSTGNGFQVICSFSSVSFSAQSPNDYPSAPMG